MDNSDFSVELAEGRIKLEHPIMNGPGWACKTVEDVEKLAASASSGIVVGAITCKERMGNLGNTHYFDLLFLSSNFLGMPNGGLPYYRDRDALSRMVEIAHEAGKPIFVNVAGFNDEEFVELAVFVEEAGVDGVQLNLSCSNVRGRGIICYDLDATERVVRAVMGAVDIPVDVKLSPFSNPFDRREMALLMKVLRVPIVTLCNTFPNVLIYDAALKPVIHSATATELITTGGMGGPAMKPIALAHVETFRSILYIWQDIIGIGGVESGRDVVEYETAGASAVQLTTAHARRGTRIFGQILQEYAA